MKHPKAGDSVFVEYAGRVAEVLKNPEGLMPGTYYLVEMADSEGNRICPLLYEDTVRFQRLPTDMESE